MNHQNKLKKEMCLGKLIWIQPPSAGSAVFFAKKLLIDLGISGREITYLTARQFLRYAEIGFSRDFLKTSRVILVGDLEDLSLEAKLNILEKLSLYKMFKLRFDINLMLISPPYFEIAELILQKFQPSVIQIFEEGDPIGINEKIHDLIEKAVVDSGKPIWRLSLQTAEFLEITFLTRGEDYLRSLLKRAVAHSQNKQLDFKDVSLAQQFVDSFESRENRV